jgi:predicted DNA-binding transcriptional regulator AlpA
MSSDSQLIRRPEVLRITGLKKSTLYQLMRLDIDPFPPNYPISERGRAWIKAEVIDWCERRRKAERKVTSIEKTVQLRLAERAAISNRRTG